MNEETIDYNCKLEVIIPREEVMGTTTSRCMYIGNKYFAEGDLEYASRHYYEALKLSPKHKRAYDMIMTCDYHLKSRTALVPYVEVSWEEEIRKYINMTLDNTKSTGLTGTLFSLSLIHI